MEDPKTKTNSNWKWLLAGAGVILAYSMGYGQGSSDRSTVYAPTTYSDTAAASEPLPFVTATDDATTAALQASDAADIAARATEDQSADDGDDGDDGDTYAPSHPTARQFAGYSAGSDTNGYTGRDDQDQSAAEADDTGNALASDTPSASGLPTPSYRYTGNSYPLPVATTSPKYGCSETGSCYGDISTTTGLPKTTYVHGYFRSNGTYVGSYYRSHR